MSPGVSVIIPAYNAALFIENAINSVLDQSYHGPIEILVVDDGSSDNTKTIVSEMSCRYPHIIPLSNERKKGPSGARNTGLLRASGNYIAFLDADDIWLPDHLESGVRFLEANDDVDIVFFNFDIAEMETKKRISDWFTERQFSKKLKTKEMGDRFHLITDDMFNALLAESFIHLQSMIIRKKALGELLFNEDIKRSEDTDFAIRLYADSNARFAFKNMVTGIYFRHQSSLSSSSIENALFYSLDNITIFSGYLSDYSLDNNMVVRLRQMIFERYMSASYYYRKLANHKLALVFLMGSFKYKIAFSQLLEFSKITVSFFNHQKANFRSHRHFYIIQ